MCFSHQVIHKKVFYDDFFSFASTVVMVTTQCTFNGKNAIFPMKILFWVFFWPAILSEYAGKWGSWLYYVIKLGTNKIFHKI